MRLYIQPSINKTVIPFSHQHLLTGCIHKWIGKANLLHGQVSLYSFSWLQNVKTTAKGLWLTPASYFFINFYDPLVAVKVLRGIWSEPSMFGEASVNNSYLGITPTFSKKETFFVASPVFIKRTIKDNEQKHYLFSDKESASLMTETLKTKLRKAQLPEDHVSVRFDTSYHSPKTKLIRHKKTKNKASMCPVVIEGSPEQIAFAWNVGIGNSTGIGFGALK